MAGIIPFAIGVWIIVGVCLYAMATEGMIETHSAVFWPIALVKWLIMQLVLVLFTGWKP